MNQEAKNNYNKLNEERIRIEKLMSIEKSKIYQEDLDKLTKAVEEGKALLFLDSIADLTLALNIKFCDNRRYIKYDEFCCDALNGSSFSYQRAKTDKIDIFYTDDNVAVIIENEQAILLSKEITRDCLDIESKIFEKVKEIIKNASL